MAVNVVEASAGVSPLRRSYERPLWILMAVAGLVLLLAAVNLANLLLARATARRQEFAVRLAIGGTRGRVIQQVLTESLLLAAIGSIAAVGVALAVSRSIPPLMSTVVDRIHLDLSPDWRVFGFTTLVGMLTALVFGLAPAIRAVRRVDRGRAASAVAPATKASRCAAAGGRAGRHHAGADVRRPAVPADVPQSVDAGARHRRARRRRRQRVLPRGRAAAAKRVPMRIAISTRGCARCPAWSSWPRPTRRRWADRSPIPKSRSIASRRRGQHQSRQSRLLRDAGHTDSSPAATSTQRDTPRLDQGGARHQVVPGAYLKGAGVGAHFTVPDDLGGGGNDYEVIGVIADQKYLDIREAQAEDFLPAVGAERRPPRPDPPLRDSRRPAAGADNRGDHRDRGRVRSDGDDPLRAAGHPGREAMLQERLMARLSSIFGGVALLLAIVGLYGVVSYGVASRRAGDRRARRARREPVAHPLDDPRRCRPDHDRRRGRWRRAGAGRGPRHRVVAVRIQAVRCRDPGDGSRPCSSSADFWSAAWPAKRAAGIDPVSALRES